MTVHEHKKKIVFLKDSTHDDLFTLINVDSVLECLSFLPWLKNIFLRLVLFKIRIYM